MEQCQNSHPPWEKAAFLILITLVGGYMNAYTFMTRNEILANMHTANMSRLGISLALAQWHQALLFFLPIVACIFGSVFSELLKEIVTKREYNGDWRKLALLFEAALLFLVGLLPLSAPDIPVTLLVSFIMGYQLCLFRNCMGVAHNTTICTGNIRNVGTLFYKAAKMRTSEALKKLGCFAALTFSFAAGAVPGTLCSLILEQRAVWPCCIVLILQSFWISRYERRRFCPDEKLIRKIQR